MKFQFNEAVCVVTGGGSGLGACLVKMLAKRGAKIIILDLRKDRMDESLVELHEQGIDAMAWECDVADREKVKQIFQKIVDRFGQIDLLINCAGRSLLVPFMDMTDEEMDWVTAPNLFGVINCIRAAVPSMPQGSRIINITSVSGKVPTPGEAHYSAMKMAIASLTESLQIEFKRRGIGMMAVFPGEMTTGLYAEHASWEKRPDFQRNMEVPPEVVAGAVIKGIEKNKTQVTSPFSMAASMVVYRFFPKLFQKGVERIYYKPIEDVISLSNPDGK